MGRLQGICIAHADGTNLRVLVSQSFVCWTDWSPDGTRIAYTNANASPATQDLHGGRRHRRDPFVAEGTVADWLDDHTLIVEHVSPG